MAMAATDRNPDAFPGIDAAARAAYRRDGVICLRKALTAQWLDCTRRGIERNLREPGPFFRDQTPDGSPARYLFDYWNWERIPEFGQFMSDSPMAAQVSALLQAKRLFMVMDNWFLREGGATNGAPWHHDEPYFDFVGGQLCIYWFALDAATSEEGLTFVAGSHAWGKLFQPQQFKVHRAFDGVTSDYHPIEDFEADRGNRLLSWDLEPGDALIFDFRTLHRATCGPQPPSRTVQRMSYRFADQDTVFRPRGEWTREISDYLIARGQRPDRPLDCPLLPCLAKPSAR